MAKIVEFDDKARRALERGPKTKDVPGDGTTAATILAQFMIKKCGRGAKGPSRNPEFLYNTFANFL